MQRALVVGSGSIAKRHIKNLRKLYPEAEVICVSASGRSIDPIEVGASSVRGSIELVLKEASIDLAIVASPAPLHLQTTFKLASANIPVLVEKPLCQDETELEKYDLANPNYKVGVGYNLRYMPSANTVEHMLSNYTFGKFYMQKLSVGTSLTGEQIIG